MAFGTFDSLNPFSIKGIAVAEMSAYIYDELMSSSPDEPSTGYGLIAEWVSYPDDFSSATFQLRSGARFHDGKPITPEDVIFSLDALKKAHPHFARYYKNVVKAEKVGDNQVKFTFDVTGNRELPHHCRPAFGSSQAFLGGNGQQRRAARSRQVDARSPAGLGPLPHQGGRCRPRHHLRAR